MNELISYQEKLKQVKRSSISQESKRAIVKHWKLFEEWCKKMDVKSLPCHGSTLEAYLIRMMENKKKVSTIEQAKWAIDVMHKHAELPLPSQSESLQTVMKGIRRIAKKNIKQQKAFTIDHIKQLQFKMTLAGIRDKTILLIGFAGGLRRSEISNIKIENIEFQDYGMRIMIENSKTNQEGHIEYVDITFASSSDYCPISSLKQWLEKSNIKEGYIFRSLSKSEKVLKKLSDVSIGQIVKKAAKSLGLNESQYSGHSLRSGCATFLLDKKVALNIVAKQLRHKNYNTTLRYDRNSTIDQIKNLF